MKFTENIFSDIVSLQVYNISPYKTTLPLGLVGYSELNATTFLTIETAYRGNNFQKLLDICQSTILNEELSINNITSDSNSNAKYLKKTPYLTNIPSLEIYNRTTENPNNLQV